MREARWYSALLKHQWNRWFVGFDSTRQQVLLESLGMQNFSLQALTGIAFGVSFTILISLAFWFFHGDVNKIDRTVRLYSRFCDKMSRNGVTREPWEGPEDFCYRCIREFPHLEKEIRSITQLYLSVRYRDHDDEMIVKNLQSEIGSLNLT